MIEGKLWGGRFTKSPQQWVEEFNASISYDQKLVLEDIEGSIAHSQMLAACGIITNEEATVICKGLQTLRQKAEKGELTYAVEYEDIHLNIEKLLYEEIGAVAGKLHTARSRNDQVATDMHLFLKKNVNSIKEQIQLLQKAFVDKAEKHIDTIIPGYTHLQRAQPISFAHHLLAYFWMLQRDYERFHDSLARIDCSPLGAGALAGTTFPIDRFYTKEKLGFQRIYENSLDAVSDRDFIIEFQSNASLLMMHLSRFCEELILWSSQEFNFIELDDSYTTGSSMMPQKKNPDMAELIRGKTGRVYGNLMGILTILKGLPLTYNKDLQEDKEGMFDTVTTLKGCLTIMTGMIETMTVNEDGMEHACESDYSTATELADYLAAKGIPFREAHEIVGKTVLLGIQQGKLLHEFSIAEYKAIHSSIDADVYKYLLPRTAVQRRNSYGGTGFEQVKNQLEIAKSHL